MIFELLRVCYSDFFGRPSPPKSSPRDAANPTERDDLPPGIDDILVCLLTSGIDFTWNTISCLSLVCDLLISSLDTKGYLDKMQA